MADSRKKLRSLLGAATRWGDEDEAVRIKALLVVLSIEAKIRSQLDGQPLLSVEAADQLCALIRSYAAPDPDLSASLAGLPDQVAAYGEQLDLLLATGEPLDPAQLAQSV